MKIKDFFTNVINNVNRKMTQTIVPWVTNLYALAMKTLRSISHVIVENQSMFKNIETIMEINYTNHHQGMIPLYETSGGIEINVIVMIFG